MMKISIRSLVGVLMVVTLFFMGGLVASAQKVEINFAFEAGRQAEAAQYLLADWNKTHPNIKVEIIPLPYQSREIQQKTMLAAHSSEIDGFSHANMSEYGSAGWLLPLDKYLEKELNWFEDFFAKHVELCKLPPGVELSPELRGTYYAMPYDSGAMILFYRKDLYEKYGLALPDMLEGLSWEEFVSNCKVLNRPEENIYGTALAGMKGAQQLLRIESFAVSFGGEPILNQNLEPVLTTEPWIKALQGYKDLLETVSPPGVWEYDYAEQNTAFAQGIVGHMLQWMVAINTVEDPDTSRVAGSVGYGVYVGGGKSAGGSWLLSVNAFSKHPDETWEFLEFLNNKENAATQALLFSNDIIRKSTFSDPRFLEKFPEAQAMLKGLEGTFNSLPNIPEFGEIWNVMSEELSAAVVGIKTVYEALESAEKRIKKIME
jgi:sorbitol/mannitol transport system substrate-binding protein